MNKILTWTTDFVLIFVLIFVVTLAQNKNLNEVAKSEWYAAYRSQHSPSVS